MPSDPAPHERHWEAVYRSTASEELSWFTAHPSTSLEIIKAVAPSRDSRIIDVGGGDSRLVDHLLEERYRHLTVLDISPSAIERAQARLRVRAKAVTWIVEDVLKAKDVSRYDVWHDRALLHFLKEAHERDAYVAALRRALVPGGAAVFAVFAPDGPDRCSGLEVRRYDEKELAAELGGEFKLIGVRRETHHTPRNVDQRFIYVSFRKRN